MLHTNWEFFPPCPPTEVADHQCRAEAQEYRARYGPPQADGADGQGQKGLGRELERVLQLGLKVWRSAYTTHIIRLAVSLSL